MPWQRCSCQLREEDKRLKIKLLILIGLCLVIGASVASAQSDELPAFKADTCRFNEPFGVEVDCGYLLVPENRANPDGNRVRLHVAIFRAQSDTPQPDPIIYLEGGPGGSPLTRIDLTYGLYFEPYTLDRDLIVIDQRGVGFSEPSLECPEADQAQLDLLSQDFDPEAAYAIAEDAFATCYNRLTEQGIDLSAYNTVENAADIADLRVALGLEEVNLWGISYGTKLALTIMRDHPEGIRSVILDSVYPLEENLYTTYIPHAQRAFDQLFATCAADAACSAAYPDLEQTFWQTVERLNANPVRVDGTLPSSGEVYDVLITGNLVTRLLFTTLYQANVIPSLPQIITAASEDDFALLTVLYMSTLDSLGVLSDGMSNSVQCVEEIPFGDVASYSAQIEGHPNFEAFFAEEFLGGAAFPLSCEVWQVEVADALENQPVQSDIPTLVMTGQFDPITPPAWGEQVAQTLSNATYFNYPAVGHGASVSADCPRQMALAFLDDPNQTLDAACLAAMAVNFITPTETYTFVPYESSNLGIQTVVPEGWQELAPGTFARSALGDVAVAVLPLTGVPVDQAAQLLAESILGSDAETPQAIDQLAANGRTWEIYALEVQGLGIRMAITDVDGNTYLILLQAPPAEIDALQLNILIPVIEAFVVME